MSATSAAETAIRKVILHTNLEGLQVLAYSSEAEVPHQSRRIVMAATIQGLDLSFGMGVVLARDMARALRVAADAPHRETMDRFDDRCLEFFGVGEGGWVSRSNELDPENKLPTVRLQLCGDNRQDSPRATLPMTASKCRALAAALLTATEAVIAESTVQMAAAMPPSYVECRKQRQHDGWPGDADDIAEAQEREALLPDTLGATPLEQPVHAHGNGGW